MDTFDLRKYLAEGRLLKEGRDAVCAACGEHGYDEDLDVDCSMCGGFEWSTDYEGLGKEFGRTYENISMEDGDDKVTYYAKELIKMHTPGDEGGVEGLLTYLNDNPEEMPENWDEEFIDEYYNDIMDQIFTLTDLTENKLLKEEDLNWVDAHKFVLDNLLSYETPSSVMDKEFLKINIEQMLKDEELPQELLGAVEDLLIDDEGLDMVIEKYKEIGPSM